MRCAYEKLSKNSKLISIIYSPIKMPSPFVNKDVEDIVCSSVQLLTHDESNAADYISWLQKAPKLTTYRVNPLKADIDKLIKTIQAHLETKRKEYSWKTVPRVYQHFPDTIGIETWSEENGLDQLLVGDGLPSVIVDASCGAAVLRGANVFAPAVMGLPPGIGINDDVNIFADVSGDCKKGLKGDYTNGVKIFVGRGKLKMSRYELFGDKMKPRGIGIQTVMPVSMVPVIDQEVLTPGDCLLQNLPSIICGKVLNPEPGETVLDMCAAPGNKTTHLAELMGNKGTIIAIDKIANKIDTIKKRCQESSITCVHPFAFDSTKAVLEDSSNSSKNVLEGPPFAPETFDKILLDVPCSALGQRPLLSNKMTVKMLKSYVPLQRKLFQVAVKLLKPGGHLVYSTCTTTKEECETMVAWALATFPDLNLIPATPIYGNPGWPNSGLNDEQRLMVQRFGPGKDALRRLDAVYYDTIGFFISSFEKQK